MSVYVHRSYPNFDSAAAVAEYNEQRQNAKADNLMRYKQKFQESINPQSLQALEISGDQDKIIETIDKAMIDSLQDSFNKAAGNFDLMEMANTAGEAGKAFFKTREVEQLNIFFANIAEATNLAVNSGNEVAVILSKVINKKVGGKAKLTYLNQLVQKSLIKFPKGSSLTVQDTVIKNILLRLSKLSSALDDTTNKTVNRVANLTTGIFSTDMGEYVTAYVVSQTFGQDVNQLLKALTGSRKIKMEYIKELEKFTKIVKATKPMKADASLSNLKIKIDSGSKDVVFDLGISTKWYRTLDLKAKTGEVKVTTEKLRGLMNFLNKTNTYNTVALKSYKPEKDPTDPPARGGGGVPLNDYNLLIRTIVERNLDSIISGSGEISTKNNHSVVDFTQYMIINGKIISIYQLLTAIISNNSERSPWYHATVNGQTKIDALLKKRLADGPSDKIRAVANSQEVVDLIEGVTFQVELKLAKIYNLMN